MAPFKTATACWSFHGRLRLALLGGKNGRFGQRHGIVGESREESGRIGPRRLDLAARPQQHPLDRQQACPRTTFRQQPLHVLEAGGKLLSFQQPVDLAQLADKIAAAELDLLAGATRAVRIGVDGHGSTVGFRMEGSRLRPGDCALLQTLQVLGPPSLIVTEFTPGRQGPGVSRQSVPATRVAAAQIWLFLPPSTWLPAVPYRRADRSPEPLLPGGACQHNV